MRPRRCGGTGSIGCSCSSGAARLARLQPPGSGRAGIAGDGEPAASAGELLRLGLGPLWRERSLLALPLLNALAAGIAAARRPAPVRAPTTSSISAPTARRRFAAAGAAAGPPAAAAGRRRRPAATASGAGRSRSAISARRWRPAAPIWRSRRSRRRSPRGLDARLAAAAAPGQRPSVPEPLSGPGRAQPARDAIECRVGMLAPAGAARRPSPAATPSCCPFRVHDLRSPAGGDRGGLSGRPTIVLPAPGVDEIARRARRHRRGVARRPARGRCWPPRPGRRRRPVTVPPGRTGRRPSTRCSIRPAAALARLPAGGARRRRRRRQDLPRCDALRAPAASGGHPPPPGLEPLPQLPVQAAPGADAAHRPQPQGSWTATFASATTISPAGPGSPGRSCACRSLDNVLDIWWRYHRPPTGGSSWPIAASTTRWSTSPSTPGWTSVVFGRLGALAGRALLPEPRLAVVLNRSGGRDPRRTGPMSCSTATSPAAARSTGASRAEFGLPVLENDARRWTLGARPPRAAGGCQRR